MIRGGQSVAAVYRGGQSVKRVYRGHTEVWSASPYPLAGTFEIVNGEQITGHEIFTHTVVEPGDFTGTVTVESGRTTLYNWTLNGGGQTGGLTRTYTGLSVGDTIRVETVHTGTLNLSGTWSLVKN